MIAAAPACPLLSVRGLKVHIALEDGMLHAIDGIDLDLMPGETFALVGESGCGKSMFALSLMGLLPGANVRAVEGSVLFEGRELLRLEPRQMRRLRGNRIGMIFQEPMTALNPVHSVGAQIVEAIRAHRKTGRREAVAEAVDLLDRVGIPAPSRRIHEYPHQFSGGMRQRAMIAMAMASRPSLLIADEPTTALDVTIQAQILDLLDKLKAEYGMSILLITHNFGIVAQTARRTAVMYAGRIVEEAETGALFADPRHPYTRGLLRSIPRLGMKKGGRKPIPEILGTVMRSTGPATACAFAPRCDIAFAQCREQVPARREVPLRAGHAVRCFADTAQAE